MRANSYSALCANGAGTSFGSPVTGMRARAGALRRLGPRRDVVVRGGRFRLAGARCAARLRLGFGAWLRRSLRRLPSATGGRAPRAFGLPLAADAAAAASCALRFGFLFDRRRALRRRPAPAGFGGRLSRSAGAAVPAAAARATASRRGRRIVEERMRWHGCATEARGSVALRFPPSAVVMSSACAI